jgi:hypothetical protein
MDMFKNRNKGAVINMKTIIYIPFAYSDKKQSGVNISNTANKREVYEKNLCVALISAKYNNPNSDVALVTNIEISQEYAVILNNHDIKQIIIPFDMFLFPDVYKWGLAFYKLCSLYHIVREYEYDCYCYLDADVYVQHSLSYIWEECKQNILLYDINHGLQVADYRRFVSELRDFQVNEYITHYGGEFFAANHENAILFSEKCLEIFEQMLQQAFETTIGDEFVLSLAAQKMQNIKNAGAYIYRYWTGTFRLVSTNYLFNEVLILHVPSEKQTGMIVLFDRYIRRGCQLSNRTVHRVLHLSTPSFKTRLKNCLKTIKTVLGKRV